MFWSKLFKKKGYKVKMPNNKTTTTKTTTSSGGLHEGAVREIVTSEVRNALREQAREIEQHLNSIDDRLRQLERK